MLLFWVFKCIFYQLLIVLGLTFLLMLPPIFLFWLLSLAPAYLYEFDDQDFMGDSHDNVTPHWYAYYLHWFEAKQSWVPELAKYFQSEEEGEEEEAFEDEAFVPDSYVLWGLSIMEKIRGRNALLQYKFEKKKKEKKYFLVLKK